MWPISSQWCIMFYFSTSMFGDVSWMCAMACALVSLKTKEIMKSTGPKMALKQSINPPPPKYRRMPEKTPKIWEFSGGACPRTPLVWRSFGTGGSLRHAQGWTPPQLKARFTPVYAVKLRKKFSSSWKLVAVALTCAAQEGWSSTC